MKSGRQRRGEIKAKRNRQPKGGRYFPGEAIPAIPHGAVRANPDALLHDNTYGPRPAFYVDRPFNCVDCGAREVWRATQQKWWYEVAKGKIGSAANRCNPCRRRVRAKRTQERQRHIEGLIEKYGLESAAARLNLTVLALTHLQFRKTR